MNDIDWRRVALALWRLLDDIDTQDDASRENDAHFRLATGEIQRRRFQILSGEQFDTAEALCAPRS